MASSYHRRGLIPRDFLSGEFYGWRVRTTEPVLSPWSEMWRFYPRLLAVSDLQPDAGATNVDMRPVFTWHGPAMADAYEFTLATDPDFNNVVVSFSGDTALDTTDWVCNRDLSNGTNYFWRVRSVSVPANSPWATGAFVTAPAASASPSMVGGDSVLEMPVQQQSPVSDYLIWAMFGLAALLMVGLIVLILRTGRR